MLIEQRNQHIKRMAAFWNIPKLTCCWPPVDFFVFCLRSLPSACPPHFGSAQTSFATSERWGTRIDDKRKDLFPFRKWARIRSFRDYPHSLYDQRTIRDILPLYVLCKGKLFRIWLRWPCLFCVYFQTKLPLLKPNSQACPKHLAKITLSSYLW